MTRYYVLSMVIHGLVLAAVFGPALTRMVLR